MVILEGRTLLTQPSKEDSQLEQCKLFGCHLFPSQLWAEFTLKYAMCISFKLQRTGIPTSATRSYPNGAAAWSWLFPSMQNCSKNFSHLGVTTWLSVTYEVSQSTKLQSASNSSHRTHMQMHANGFCHQISQTWKKFNLIVDKLFLDGKQCGRF